MLHKCRICTEPAPSLVNIFTKKNKSKIALKMMSLAKVEVYPKDGLPSKICAPCNQKLDNFMQFKYLVEESDAQFRSTINLNNSCDDSEAKGLISMEESMDKNDKIENIPIPTVREDKSTSGDDIDNTSCKKEVKETIESDSKSKQKEIAINQCFACGKIMSSRFRLKIHLRIHTGEKPYSCQYCSKSFGDNQDLKVHLRSHTGEKPLVCDVCGATFAHSAGLVVHKRKHTGVKPYRCTLCPKSYSTIGNLQYHIKRHTGEKTFECDTCGKAFITRGDLKQHSHSHTGSKPYVCCVCGLGMTRAFHLKRHMENAHESIHTCKTCAAKFKEKSTYEEHLKTHESVEEKNI